MSRPYDDYQPKRPVRVVRKSGVLGKILFFFIGLILGIVLIAGSVFGLGYCAFTKPTKDTVQLVDKYVDADLYSLFFGSIKQEGDKTIIQTGLFDEKYAETTVKELFGDSIDALSAFTNDGTLNDLNKVSPAVGKMVENLLKTTDELSIPIDKNTLLSTKASGLSEYLKTCAKDASFGDLLKGTGTELSPMLMALSYGEENVDYVVEADGTVTMLKGDKTRVKDLMAEDMSVVLNRVPIDAVVEIDPLDDEDKMMCALAYGASNRYSVVNNKVQMNQVAYTFEDKGDGVKLYNDQNEALTLVEDPTTVADEETKATIKIVFLTGETNDDGTLVSETQYLQYDTDGKLLAFADKACSSPILYKKTVLGDLQKDSTSIIDNIPLADALDIQPGESHKILLSLAYGEEGVDYDIVNGKVEPKDGAQPRTIGELRKRNTDLINSIQLCDVMDEDQDETMVMFLLYGREDVHYKIVQGVVEMQQKFIALRSEGNTTKVYNEYGEELTKKDEHNDLAGWTLTDTTYTDANGNEYTYTVDPAGRTIETKDGDAYVCYLAQDGKAVKFKKTSLGDMAGNDNIVSNLMKRVKIGEIMNEDDLEENRFLKHVKNETVESLPGALNELTIQEVYADDIYENGALKGTWWYLLTVNGVEKQYKITEMESLMDNMKANIHDATLKKLSDDGIIQFSGTTLGASIITEVQEHTVKVYTEDTNKDGTIDHNDDGQPVSEVFVKPDPNNPGQNVPKEFVGELTVEEMIYYVDALLAVIEKLNAIN